MMKNLARSHVYWPNLDTDIENTVRSCSNCALAAKSPIKTTLHSWHTPSAPWERVYIDYAGPINNSYFLVVVDAHSKWPEIIQTMTTTAKQTVKILSTIFSRFGLPKQIVSDNGAQFVSELFQQFCNRNGIEHSRSSPYSPMSNGQAERFVDTFKRALKKFGNHNDVANNLEHFLFVYRTTPNSNCPFGKAPAEVMFNRKIRTIFDFLKPPNNIPLRRNVKMEQQFNKKHGAKQRTFQVNDKLWVQIHSKNFWRWEEAIIIKSQQCQSFSQIGPSPISSSRKPINASLHCSSFNQ